MSPPARSRAISSTASRIASSMSWSSSSSLCGFERPIAHFHRIRAARHLDDRRVAEMLREALGLDRRRGDDHLEIRALRQQALEIAKQEVDVEAALVRFVDDDRVVGPQQPIALRLGEQDAVGHELHVRLGRDLVGEAHLVADRVAQRASPAPPRCARPPCARRCAAAVCGRSGRSTPRPSSRQIFGSCVVLPEPVSPHTITTWCSRIARAISSRRATTGRSSG